MKLTPSNLSRILFLGLASILATGCASLARSGPAADATQEIPLVTAERTISVEGHLAPVKSTWLTYERGGKLAELLVEEGQAVEAGEVLARLEGRAELQAAVTAAELDLLDAQQTLDRLVRDADLVTAQARQTLVEAELASIDAQEALEAIDTETSRQRIEDAWERVMDAREALEDAQEEFDKYKDFGEDNANRQRAEQDLEDSQERYDTDLRAHDRLVNELEQARALASQAKAALANARREYEARLDGPHPDDLALAQARLENSQAWVAAARQALDDLDLASPYAGLVVHVPVNAGEPLRASQQVVQLADLSSWYVETSDLTELEVVQIDPQEPVTITLDALPDLALKGNLERLSQYFNQQGGDVLYTARIRLDSTDPRLRWGMTVNVEFEKP